MSTSEMLDFVDATPEKDFELLGDSLPGAEGIAVAGLADFGFAAGLGSPGFAGLALGANSVAAGPDMVMFTRHRFLGFDTHGAGSGQGGRDVVAVRVLRLGACRQTCSVVFSTEDADPDIAASNTSRHLYVPVKRRKLTFAPGETLKTVEVILVYDKRCCCRSIFSTRGVTPRPPPTAANISRATRWESNISFKVHLRDPTGGAKLGPLGEAGLDEGLLSFSLPHFRLYGESL
jgi:hypothetical protein